MIVLSDTGFHAAEGDPANLKLCQRGEWQDRMLVETVLSMLTLGRVDELFDDDPGGNEMNQSQKGLAQFLISGRNTAKLFEVIEEPFHLLA